MSMPKACSPNSNKEIVFSGRQGSFANQFHRDSLLSLLSTSSFDDWFDRMEDNHQGLSNNWLLDQQNSGTQNIDEKRLPVSFEPVPIADHANLDSHRPNIQIVEKVEVTSTFDTAEKQGEVRSLLCSLFPSKKRRRMSSSFATNAHWTQQAAAHGEPYQPDGPFEPLPVDLSNQNFVGMGSNAVAAASRSNSMSIPQIMLPSAQPSVAPFRPDVDNHRFRKFQWAMWKENYGKLAAFQERTGHCLVSDSYDKDLNEWVKRQRYQQKLRLQGKTSTMTEERKQMLDRLNFTWDMHEAAWEEKYELLKEFHAIHRHCNVPTSKTRPNSPLAIWVKSQRHHYRKYLRGERSTMTPARVERLNALGFEWNLRSPKRSETPSIS